MNFKKFLIPGAAMLAILATGCSKDKSDDPNKNPDGPGGSGSMEQYTPEQSKQYLSETATEFMDLFNPNDQRAIIELAAYFSDTYGDYDLPENFDVEEEEEDAYNPSDYITHLGRAMKGNLDEMTRAAYTYTYNINFDRFAGKYEPVRSTRSWAKTGNSSDIVFAFTDAEGLPCELRITKSGNSSDFTIDWEESYDDSYYDYVYSEKYVYNLSIPKTINAELKQNGNVLATSKVTSEIDLNGHKLSANAEIEAANIKALAAISGNDSKIGVTAEFRINGETKCSSYATINGNGLCDRNRIEDLIDSEWNKNILAQTLTNGVCGADALGKVQVYGQVTYDSEILDIFDSSWDHYDYASVSMAEYDCKTACNKLNALVKAQLRFNNKATDQASLLFQPSFDSWNAGNSWEYIIEPVLYFDDETTLSFDKYFSNFNTVENKWEVLINSYEKIWNNALPSRRH